MLLGRHHALPPQVLVRLVFFLSVFPDRCGREQTKQNKNKKKKKEKRKKKRKRSRVPPPSTSRRYGVDSSFSSRCQATRHVPTPPAAFRELLIHKKFSVIKKKGKKKEDDDEGDLKRLGDAYERVYDALFKAHKVAGSSRHNRVTIVPQSINGFSAALGATRSRPPRERCRGARALSTLSAALAARLMVEGELRGARGWMRRVVIHDT